MTTQVSHSTPSIQLPPMERAPGVVVVTLKSEEGKSYKVSVKGPEAFLNDNQKVMEIANELLSLAKVYDVGNKTQSLTLKKTENLSTLVQTRAAPKKDGATVVTHQGQSIEEILTIRRNKIEHKLTQLSQQASDPASQPEKEKLEQKFNHVRQSIDQLSQKKKPKIEDEEEQSLILKSKKRASLPKPAVDPASEQPVKRSEKIEEQKQETLSKAPLVEVDPEVQNTQNNAHVGPLEASVASCSPPSKPSIPSPPTPPAVPASLASTQNKGKLLKKASTSGEGAAQSIQDQLKEKVQNLTLKRVPPEKINDRSSAVLDPTKKTMPIGGLAQQLATSKAFLALQNANRDD